MKIVSARLCLALCLLLLLAGCGNGENIETYQEAAPAPEAQSQLPADHPPLGGEYTWQAPEGWESQPPSPMRMGSYLVPHGGEQGDLSVIRLAGQAGGPLNNLNRWRGQLGLQSVSEGSPEATGRSVTSPVGPFTVWHLESGEPVNQGMLVAMYFAGDHTLFIKLTGPIALVAGVEDQFTAYLESFTVSEEG